MSGNIFLQQRNQKERPERYLASSALPAPIGANEDVLGGPVVCLLTSPREADTKVGSASKDKFPVD